MVRRRARVVMETAVDRAEKSEAIETLKGVFANAGAVVVTHYLGLTVAQITELRHRLRQEGATLQVVKNTLAIKALNGAGERPRTSSRARWPSPTVPTPSRPPRSRPSTPRKTRSSPWSGPDGRADVLDAKAVDALAKLPSLDQLRGKIIGLLRRPRPGSPAFSRPRPASSPASSNAYATKDAA